MEYPFTFDPKKKGLRQVLGDLEAAIMDVVWKKNEATVRQVHESLSRGREIAYTTVMTVMTRLADKGLLEKTRDGSAHVYRPAVSRDDFTESTVKQVMGRLLEDFTAPAISQFVDYFGDDPEKIEKLAQLIEEKRRKRDA